MPSLNVKRMSKDMLLIPRRKGKLLKCKMVDLIE